MQRGRTLAALLTTLVVAGSCALSVVPTAQAFPSRERVEQARASAAQKAEDVSAIKARLVLANLRLQSASVRAEQASEAYNGAVWRLQQAKASYRAAQGEAARARRTVSTQRDRIGALVAQSYQEGGDLSALNAVLGAHGAEGVLDGYAAFQGASTSLEADYQRFGASDAVARVLETKARSAKLAEARSAARAKRARAAALAAAQAAQSEATAIAAEKARLVRELARAQHISVALARSRQAALEEIARKRAEERARRAAAAAAAAQAQEQARQQARQQDQQQAQEQAREAARRQTGPRSTRHSDRHSRGSTATPEPAAASVPAPSPAPVPAPAPAPAPSSSGGAQQAIRFAESQLGDPYQWGAAGPGTWDCSGLTMGAWGSAGVSLPHYSVAQYYAGVPISVSQLRPGDLVFWSTNGTPGGIHHVAMYIGGGQIIHAPRTGRPVEIDPMYYWIPPNFFVRV